MELVRPLAAAHRVEVAFPVARVPLVVTRPVAAGHPVEPMARLVELVVQVGRHLPAHRRQAHHVPVHRRPV